VLPPDRRGIKLTEMRARSVAIAILVAAACSSAEPEPRRLAPTPPAAHASTVPPDPPDPPAPTRHAVTLAAGTDHETPCHVFDSGREGEVVLVLAGIHGDEPAPPVAAGRIAGWSVERGKLLVVPAASPPALRAGTRHIPGAMPIDLNRQFPSASALELGHAAAEALWRVIVDERVTWLVDLHEGWDFHKINPKSIGSSVTWVPKARSADAALEMAKRVLGAINGAETRPRHPFVLVSPGPARSVARAVSEQHGIASLVIETTKVGQPIETRVVQHELAVREVLARLGMLGS